MSQDNRFGLILTIHPSSLRLHPFRPAPGSASYIRLHLATLRGILGEEAPMTPYAPYPLNLLRDWLHRRRWWVRLVMALVLVPWFGYFAHTRMTTPPGSRSALTDWSTDSRPANGDSSTDQSKEMAAAM